MDKYKQRLTRSFSVIGKKALVDPPESGASAWRFWKRLPGRRGNHRPRDPAHKAPDHLEKADDQQNGQSPHPEADAPPLLPPRRALPDLVEAPAHAQQLQQQQTATNTTAQTQSLPHDALSRPLLPRFNSSDVPPPKPPRLFLFRSPSIKKEGPSEDCDDGDETYINCERVAELQSQVQALSSSEANNCENGSSSRHCNGANVSDCENNNSIKRVGQDKTALQNSDIYIKNNLTEDNFQTKKTTNSTDVSDKSCSENKQTEATLPRPKRYGRSRSRNNEKGSFNRQRRIMSHVSELLQQRLDPYPLLSRLNQSGVLSSAQLSALSCQRDRRAVSEAVVEAVANGDQGAVSAFCDALAAYGASTEILEILQVMQKLDHIVYDLQCAPTDASVLDEEKSMTFDIGYLAPDLSLKPLVELERVRTDKRLSRTSSRLSTFSLLDCDTEKRGPAVEPTVLPGLVMMCVYVTGHTLCGERANELANVIKSHNCISELHLGKTQLTGSDISVIASSLQDNRTVHSLDLRLNLISLNGAESIACLLHSTKSLRNLNLSSSSLDSDALKTITSAVSLNRTILDLDLSFLEMSERSCSHIRELLRSGSNLQKLRLRNCGISAAGAAQMGPGLARNLTLTTLDLSRNAFGDEGLQALVQHLPDSAVTDLCLEACGLAAVAGDTLAELVTHARRLTSLDLSNNSLGDAGAMRLAPALERTSSLQSLGLNMAGLTNDAFCRLLEVLEQNASITSLKLCYNRLGRQHVNPEATSDNLRYRLKIVTSSKPKLKILLWGNAFDA